VEEQIQEDIIDNNMIKKIKRGGKNKTSSKKIENKTNGTLFFVLKRKFHLLIVIFYRGTRILMMKFFSLKIMKVIIKDYYAHIYVKNGSLRQD
jgi:hypothetical protein